MIGSRGNQIGYRGYLVTLPRRLLRIPGVLLNTVEYMWGVVQIRCRDKGRQFLNSGEGLFILKGRNKDGRLFIQNSNFNFLKLMISDSDR
jgi:hypothetical protein